MEKKRVIALGIATLSLITAAAVTSTVAWYRGSSYLAVTDINVRLKNPELSISTDGQNYVGRYENPKSLEEQIRFTAVSSMFSDEWIAAKAEKPILKKGFHIGNKYVFNQSSDVQNADEGYFTQEFYIKSTIDAYVTLDTQTTVFKPDTENNTKELENEKFMRKMHEKYPSFSEEELKPWVKQHLDDVVKSLRLSILVLGEDYSYYIVDPYKDKETNMGGILDTVGMGYFDTYNHKEILYGEVYSNDDNKTVEECVSYDSPLENERSVAIEERSCFNANNAKADEKYNPELSYANGLRIKQENSVSLAEAEEKVLIPVTTSKPTKIVVSFYQEGWDLDNTDFIRYSHFIVDVLFKIAPTIPVF